MGACLRPKRATTFPLLIIGYDEKLLFNLRS
jgi:hypothetical protein